MLLAVHHGQISIPKGAEDQARSFYCDILGLKEIEKPDALKGRGGFWLELGPFQIHVGAEEGVERSKTKAHLAYEVSDLDLCRNTLRSHKVEIKEGIPIPGMDRFEFRDPFGNRIEFLQKN
jgi:catechol 2,3-dioxygenase-like lactoylglutathione lyase family enzyme